MPSNIRVGCRVSAAVGPKLPSPHAPPNPDGSQPKRQRAQRMRFHGTVLQSAENRRFVVYWHEVQKCATHAASQLKFVQEANLTSFSKIDVNGLIARCNVGDLNGLDKVTMQRNRTPAPYLVNRRTATQPAEKRRIAPTSTTQPAPTTEQAPIVAPAATVAPAPPTHAASTVAARTTTLPGNPTETNTNKETINAVAATTVVVTNAPAVATTPVHPVVRTNTTTGTTESVNTVLNVLVGQDEQEANADAELYKEAYDPQSVMYDFLEFESEDRHLLAQERYHEEKTALVQGPTEVVVATQQYRQVWKVVEEQQYNETHVAHKAEFQSIGIFDFPFKALHQMNQGSKYQRIHCLDLLIHLWPGDWEEQLKSLNHYIQEENAT